MMRNDSSLSNLIWALNVSRYLIFIIIIVVVVDDDDDDVVVVIVIIIIILWLRLWFDLNLLKYITVT